MKTLKKIPALLLLLAGIMLRTSIVFSQCLNTVGGLTGPNRIEVQAPTGSFACVTNGNSICSPATSGTQTLLGMGVNNNTNINYMLDILCDPTLSTPTNMDVNISSIGGSGFTANAVGYRIGDSMMLWHNGILSSLFVGSYAGGGAIVMPGGVENTFVGNLSGRHNTNPTNSTTGIANTYVGYAAGYGDILNSMIFHEDSNVCVGVYSGYNLLGASLNVFIGNHAGYSNRAADSSVIIGTNAGYYNDAYSNLFIGNHAGFINTTGYQNVFLGNTSGFCNTTGDWNTFTGNRTGYHNTSGFSNSFYGKHCGFYNTTGTTNNFYGEHDGYKNLDGTSNCSYGSYGFWANVHGNANVVIGNNADQYGGAGIISGDSDQKINVFIGYTAVPSFISGDSNVFVGALSDINTSSPGFIQNSGAFGYGAVATANDKITLGNNLQDVGIGMSGLDVGVGPTNKLEISYFSDPSGPDPCTTLTVTSTFTSSCGGSTPSGASGLQFRDLTNASTPYPYDTTSAFLTVDDLGNVVLMQVPEFGGKGIGTCNQPSIFPPGSFNDPSVNLQPNHHNFWFEGNTVSSRFTNVYMGYNCSDYPHVPLAKLNVLEESGSNNTIAEYVQNNDMSNGSIATSSFEPLIGIESFIPPPSSSGGYYNVAGWFEALPPSNSYIYPVNREYAIFVPQEQLCQDCVPLDGGTVDIGYPFATDQPDFLLDVNGYARIAGSVVPSDSTLKRNITPFKYGLKAIRNLNPISYKYNGIGGFDSTGTYIGLIAQNLKRNVPPAVISSSIVKDTVSHDTAAILNIYDQAVMYTAINAIKQLDSTVTVKSTTIDSLRTTLDSLRNAFKNIQNCLNTLCGSGGDAPVHHSGSNGNSGDSNATITNTQEVMLSAATNAPLLYQNIPNPFSTGTKINYYLPQGTIGATIVFYDTYGNQLKTVPLSQTGNGTLNITPDNLSAGIYSYSLIVNNNVIDTKRMLLQK